MPGRVRFETRPSDGKERIRHNDGEAERYVYVHRLAMYAWDPGVELEDLWVSERRHRRLDKLHVHHDVPIGWLNTERNLSWEDPRDHGKSEAGRRERSADGRYARAAAPAETGAAAPSPE